MRPMSKEKYFDRGYQPSREDLYKKIDEWYGESLNHHCYTYNQLVNDVLKPLKEDSRRESQYDFIYMHYFLSISITNIAYNSGKSAYSVEQSIKRGLANVKKNIEKLDKSKYQFATCYNSEAVYRNMKKDI